MKKENIPASAVTEEQIAAWKAQHGDVFKIGVDGRTAYLRTPDRKTLAYATSVAATNPMRSNEVLLDGCWLGGDEEIKTNDGLFLSASNRLAEIVQLKECTLEKL